MAPTADADVDVLFEVKNAFYLGNYQQCITDAQKTRTNNEELKIQRDCFLYRSYIAQKKYRIALDEINSESASELQAVRMLAEYLAADDRKRITLVEEMEQKGQSGDLNNMFFLMSAQIYMKENNFDSALRILNNGDDLECHACTVQCLLKIDRIELALKEMKRMQELDEDATITQLALAWTNMAVGKDKLQDAFYIYQEMIDKYGETPQLLVAQAGCLIQQQKYEQAESLLQEALQRDANNPEALINMIVVGQFLGKPLEQCNRLVNQMREVHPAHPWTRDLVSKEELFQRLTAESAA